MRKPSFLTAAHADVGFDNLTGSRIHLTSEERLAGQGMVKKLAPKPKEQEPMKSSPVAVGRRRAADVPDSHRFPQKWQESQLRTVHRVQRCLQGLLPSSSLAEVSLFKSPFVCLDIDQGAAMAPVVVFEEVVESCCACNGKNRWDNCRCCGCCFLGPCRLLLSVLWGPAAACRFLLQEPRLPVVQALMPNS